MIIDQTNKNAISTAIATLNAGKILGIPTDTVYGLAVMAKNYDAIEELYKIKGRDPEKPIAIFVKNLTAAKEIFRFNKAALEMAEELMPGKLTMILEIKPSCSKIFPANLNLKNDGFLGFRIVKNSFLDQLFTEFNEILAVSSANPSGSKAAQSAEMAESYFKNIPIIDGGALYSEASSIVKFSGEKFEILRNGALTKQRLIASLE